MPWIIEESGDCGVHWRHAELTRCYWHPRVAVLDALAIIRDEWRPPATALHELTAALSENLVAYYWTNAIRVRRGGAPAAL
ncbi:MAG TPA: hypothetical protein VF069_08640 [Streptosporangiaceae bacterium]